jgi:hypothetical protein
MTMATQAKNFRGSWRSVHMNTWDNDYPDLIEPAFIAFDKGGQGEFVFGAVKGWLDCCYGERNGRPVVEFSWEGVSEGDQICGRGLGHPNLRRQTRRPPLHPQQRRLALQGRETVEFFSSLLVGASLTGEFSRKRVGGSSGREKCAVAPSWRSEP